MINFNKRGVAVTLFVIIALLLVAGLLFYFFIWNNISSCRNSDCANPDLQPPYIKYESCIKEETETAARIAGLQGGRIDPGNYLPGSDYAPFSSHLNFLGSPIPYWYYIAGNGVIKENMPTMSEMEDEMEDFIEEGLINCDLEEFYAQGYLITKEEPTVNIEIQDNQINVNVKNSIAVSKEDKSSIVKEFDFEVKSKLGKFYDTSAQIYFKEKEEAFLEKYAQDILFLSAPVDGVEITCGPKVWSAEKIVSDLKKNIAQNFNAIKFKGDYYELLNKDREYFVVDQEVDEKVNVMFVENWPSKIEINGEGVSEELIIAEPVGTQAGLGVMGFCYVPYHYVYDLSFPALIQIYDENELFQFPVAVVIDNNVPRMALEGSTLVEEEDFNLCQYQDQLVKINLLYVNPDGDIVPADANLSYECFDKSCPVGKTKEGVFEGYIQSCYNGYLLIKGGGFSEKRELFSSNEEESISISLVKEYDLNSEIFVGNRKLNVNENAIVIFTNKLDGKSRSISFPDDNKIKLSEGLYEIKAYVFAQGNITLKGETKTECIDVPRGGLAGIFGSTKEECFVIQTPDTNIDSLLIGGGQMKEYWIDEAELMKSDMKVNLQRFGNSNPRNIQELSSNFEQIDLKGVSLEFT